MHSHASMGIPTVSKTLNFKRWAAWAGAGHAQIAAKWETKAPSSILTEIILTNI